MTVERTLTSAPPVGPPKVGLVLPGGGARAAYQVGVLRALADLLPARASQSFSSRDRHLGRGGECHRDRGACRPLSRRSRQSRARVAQLSGRAGVSRRYRQHAARQLALVVRDAVRRLAAAAAEVAVRQLAAARTAQATIRFQSHRALHRRRPSRCARHVDGRLCQHVVRCLFSKPSRITSPGRGRVARACRPGCPSIT